MHYTRFASICQNSFNFESFTHYHKWLNHAVYAVYTKSAKLCPNHRKSTYSSGFMHFFRKFLPNLFWPFDFRSIPMIFSVQRGLFQLPFRHKNPANCKGKEKSHRISPTVNKFTLHISFGPEFSKIQKNPHGPGNFHSKTSPPSLTFSSFPYILLQGLKGDALAAIRSSVFIVALFSRSPPYKNPAPLIFSDFPSLKIPLYR